MHVHPRFESLRSSNVSIMWGARTHTSRNGGSQVDAGALYLVRFRPAPWRLARSIASRQLRGGRHLRVHTLLTHISCRPHVPQSTVRPHPSEIEPQLKPWPAHVVGTQFSGTTVIVSLYDREPSVAVRVTVVVVATGAVVMVTISTLLPAEIVTLGGTLEIGRASCRERGEVRLGA